jgi:hypothetical protein
MRGLAENSDFLERIGVGIDPDTDSDPEKTLSHASSMTTD